MYEHLKMTLYKYYLENHVLGRKHIFDKFKDMGAPKRTLNHWLQLLEQGKELTRKKGSGPSIKIATPGTIRKLKNAFNHRKGCSQKKVAKKLGTSQQYVSKLLKNRTSIRCFKRTKKPKMTAQQVAVARPKCARLLRKYRSVDFILDDESYFTLSNTTLAGNDRFYSDEVEKTPYDVRNKFKAKYEPKLLVWLAISPRGLSRVRFFKSGLAINQNIYRDECMRKCLIPFIRKYYQDGKYVFWPDLASSHYANYVLSDLRDKNVKYVQKIDNPANVPKVRPIENFWGFLKQKVYEDGWEAQTIPQLRDRINLCLRRIDKSFVQTTFSAVHQRLDLVRRYGIEIL
jgi:CTP-dependent riboflavin kinase